MLTSIQRMNTTILNVFSYLCVICVICVTLWMITNKREHALACSVGTSVVWLPLVVSFFVLVPWNRFRCTDDPLLLHFHNRRCGFEIYFFHDRSSLLFNYDLAAIVNEYSLRSWHAVELPAIHRVPSISIMVNGQC